MPHDDHAVAFWDWFAPNANQIHDAYRRDDGGWLDTQISPRINSIGNKLNWEIGPYHDPDDTFVLSPTIRENLPLTRAAIAIAPQLDGWHFMHAKPPKDLLSLKFSACDCTISADDWRYRLIAYNQGEFVDVEIFVNAASEFPAAHEDLFCELVVEALIGEECRLDRVGHLMPNIVDDNTVVENSTAIRYLNDHLTQVLTRTQNEA